MRHLRFELIFAAGCLASGFIVLPWLIYWVGTLLLGPYAGGTHVGSFYGDFYRSLGVGSLEAWCLGVGPWVALLILRFLFASPDQRTEKDEDEDEGPSAPQRREPRVSG
jgi:hypothetical protein